MAASATTRSQISSLFSTNTTLRVILITRGRKTKRSHMVKLRGVLYSTGKIYFSRHTPDSDWYLNAIANSDVIVQFGKICIAGTAHVVVDLKLLKRISELKYPGEKRAKEKRVAIEVTLDDCICDSS